MLFLYQQQTWTCYGAECKIHVTFGENQGYSDVNTPNAECCICVHIHFNGKVSELPK